MHSPSAYFFTPGNINSIGKTIKKKKKFNSKALLFVLPESRMYQLDLDEYHSLVFADQTTLCVAHIRTRNAPVKPLPFANLRLGHDSKEFSHIPEIHTAFALVRIYIMYRSENFGISSPAI